MSRRMYIFARLALSAALTAALGACAVNEPRYNSPTISTNRPGLAEGTETVGAGVLQAESGYLYTRSEQERRHSIGEVLVRYGVGGGGELRLGLNSYTLQRAGDGWVRGSEDIAAGVLLQVAEAGEHPLRPAVAVLVGSTLPTGSRAWGASHAEPSGTLALAWSPLEAVGVVTNLGYAYDSATRTWTPGALHSVSVEHELRPRLRGFADYTLVTPLDGDAHRVHNLVAGVWLAINPGLMLDLHGGTAFQKGEREALIGFGLSHRW